MNWYLMVLKKYMVFNGRASRQEYWMFTLWNFIIVFCLGIVMGFMSGFGLPEVVSENIYNVYAIGILLPSLAVLTRRLHDIGRSSIWMIIQLILAAVLITFTSYFSISETNPVESIKNLPFLFLPILIYSIVIFIFAIKKGDEGENKYGPNPNEISSQNVSSTSTTVSASTPVPTQTTDNPPSPSVQ